MPYQAYLYRMMKLGVLQLKYTPPRWVKGSQREGSTVWANSEKICLRTSLILYRDKFLEERIASVKQKHRIAVNRLSDAGKSIQLSSFAVLFLQNQVKVKTKGSLPDLVNVTVPSLPENSIGFLPGRVTGTSPSLYSCSSPLRMSVYTPSS